jgi:hypothetical protein
LLHIVIKEIWSISSYADERRCRPLDHCSTEAGEPRSIMQRIAPEDSPTMIFEKTPIAPIGGVGTKATRQTIGS